MPLRGVIVEDASDNPIAYANITYLSGKVLGQSDDKGRFEFDLESRNSILIFKREGFDSSVVELQDYADLLDVVVTMRSNARHLGSATVIGGGSATWQTAKTVSVQTLEDAAGLRFDLTEHLSQMPGMSGQMDFSSNLFYDGSRAEEVAYHLGNLRIPNMRHLDIGFPGNLSVINPHAIKDINISEHYGENPFSQGLAGAIQFVPRDNDDFKASVSLGTTLREIYMEGPWLFGDGFAFSARYLDPSMLKNMGEQFFIVTRKDDDCENCNSFDISSHDLYARIFGSDSSHNTWAITGLYANDEYTINQQSIPIIKGSQNYSLASAEYQTLHGTNFHIGIVSQDAANTLRDTANFRRNELHISEEDMNFIDDYEKSHLTASAGISWEQTQNLGFALLYDHHATEKNWIAFGEDNKRTLNDNIFQASTYYRFSKSTVGAGAVYSLHGNQFMPLASADLTYNNLFGNVAWRSDFEDEELVGGASVKAGARTKIRGLELSAHGFARYYPSPILPTPKAYEYYKEIQEVDYAWVGGTGVSFDFHSLHNVAFKSNLSFIKGKYELPNGDLPWQANSRLDMTSHLRIYPTSDSLISLIISHRASLDNPLYEWQIVPQKPDAEGTRRIKSSEETATIFRTDIRLNLDLKSKVKIIFLENVRFFLEADNVFAPFDSKALRFLGGNNPRERSVSLRDNGNGYDMVPFMVEGMGFYLQFGVEGNFGL